MHGPPSFSRHRRACVCGAVKSPSCSLCHKRTDFTFHSSHAADREWGGGAASRRLHKLCFQVCPLHTHTHTHTHTHSHTHSVYAGRWAGRSVQWASRGSKDAACPKWQRLLLHLSWPRLIIYHFKQGSLTLQASQQPLLQQLWTGCQSAEDEETQSCARIKLNWVFHKKWRQIGQWSKASSSRSVELIHRKQHIQGSGQTHTIYSNWWIKFISTFLLHLHQRKELVQWAWCFIHRLCFLFLFCED